MRRQSGVTFAAALVTKRAASSVDSKRNAVARNSGARGERAEPKAPVVK
jgi:hypothetical protein